MSDFYINRRGFIKGGAALGLALAAGPLVYSPKARASGGSERVLLNIHLAGGNDGLNTVVPIGDELYDTYRGYRPDLYLADTLPITNSLGLHPAMEGIKALYDQGQVAVLENVGYPGFDRSHFRATDIYEGADPVAIPPDGWLGRALVQCGNLQVLSGVAIATTVPYSLRAEGLSAPAFTDAANYGYRVPWVPFESDAQLAAVDAMFYQPDQGVASFDGLLAGGRTAMGSSELVQAAAEREAPVAYPAEDFAGRLKLAADLIQADIGATILVTSQGGYDTHANQLVTQERLLGQLSVALAAFVEDARLSGFAYRVVIQVWSEFGRRVAQNDGGGTDHGTAGPLFVLGGPVIGGVYGGVPDLVNLYEGQDLQMTIDFRSVYATLLDRWLGIDSAGVLGSAWGHIPFLP